MLKLKLNLGNKVKSLIDLVQKQSPEGEKTE